MAQDGLPMQWTQVVEDGGSIQRVGRAGRDGQAKENGGESLLPRFLFRLRLPIRYHSRRNEKRMLYGRWNVLGVL